MAMGLVELDRMEPRMMESMEEMGEKMTAVLRAELQSTEVQLSHWVAEREQRLGDMQVCFSQEKSPVLACCPASLQGPVGGGGGESSLSCGRWAVLWQATGKAATRQQATTDFEFEELYDLHVLWYLVRSYTQQYV